MTDNEVNEEQVAQLENAVRLETNDDKRRRLQEKLNAAKRGEGPLKEDESEKQEREENQRRKAEERETRKEARETEKEAEKEARATDRSIGRGNK